MEDSLEIDISKAVVTSYEGDHDEHTGLYSGFGEASFSNGGSYEGEFEKGMFHGKGKYSWPDKSTFEGDFVNGVICGKGVFHWSNSSKYEGSLKNNKRHGTGQYTSEDGQLYDGEWVDGMREGKGKMYYNSDKSILYVGSWSQGLRDGYGIMRYASGNTYEGEWVKDKKCGRGVMIWKDVDEVYLGEWTADQPHGLGEYIWADSSAKPSLKRFMCNMYRGQWADGYRSGVGSFFYSDGSQYTGEWVRNQKDGSGVFCYPDGRVHYGFYAQDRMLLNDALPKESDAVTTQIKIHINDVIDNVCPGDAQYAESATKTIERLLLRYNSTIRQVSKRYTEFGNSRRKLATPDPLPDCWTRLDKLCYNTRNIHKRLQTSTLGDFWRFCREFSITGAHFSAYDACQCLLEMQRNRRLVAREKQREQETTAARIAADAELALMAPVITHKVSTKSLKGKTNKNSNLPPPPPKNGKTKKHVDKSETQEVLQAPKTIIPAAPVKPAIRLRALRAADVETIIVHSTNHSIWPLEYDPRLPLREYEFLELFVRCAVRSQLNLQLARGNAGPTFQGTHVDVVDEKGHMQTQPLDKTMGSTQGFGNTLSRLRTGTVKASSGVDVAEMVYGVLAEKLHAVTTDWTLIPSLIGDLYSPTVQHMFNKYMSQLLEMFKSLCAGDLSRPPTIRAVLTYLLSLRQPSPDFSRATLTADCSLLKLLGIVCDALIDDDPVVLVNNLTRLDGKLILDDFMELLCKLVLSELWVFNKQEDETSTPSAEQEALHEDGGHSIDAETRLAPTPTPAAAAAAQSSAQTIAHNLSSWFDSFRKEAPKSLVEDETPAQEREGAEPAAVIAGN